MAEKENQSNKTPQLTLLLIDIDLPIVPVGHGCFAICPWRVLNHMISRASTASQLSSTIGIWEDDDGRCVVMSSRTSTDGDGVLVLRFLLPDMDGVVLLLGFQVVVRRVVLVVVLPMPTGPVVEISEIKFKRKKPTMLVQTGTTGGLTHLETSRVDNSVLIIGKGNQ